jgi:hypothetical protein
MTSMSLGMDKDNNNLEDNILGKRLRRYVEYESIQKEDSSDFYSSKEEFPIADPTFDYIKEEKVPINYHTRRMMAYKIEDENEGEFRFRSNLGLELNEDENPNENDLKSKMYKKLKEDLENSQKQLSSIESFVDDRLKKQKKNLGNSMTNGYNLNDKNKNNDERKKIEKLEELYNQEAKKIENLKKQLHFLKNQINPLKIKELFIKKTYDSLQNKKVDKNVSNLTLPQGNPMITDPIQSDKNENNPMDILNHVVYSLKIKSQQCFYLHNKQIEELSKKDFIAGKELEKIFNLYKKKDEKTFKILLPQYQKEIETIFYKYEQEKENLFYQYQKERENIFNQYKELFKTLFNQYQSAIKKCTKFHDIKDSKEIINDSLDINNLFKMFESQELFNLFEQQNEEFFDLTQKENEEFFHLMQRQNKEFFYLAQKQYEEFSHLAQKQNEEFLDLMQKENEQFLQLMQKQYEDFLQFDKSYQDKQDNQKTQQELLNSIESKVLSYKDKKESKDLFKKHHKDVEIVSNQDDKDSEILFNEDELLNQDNYQSNKASEQITKFLKKLTTNFKTFIKSLEKESKKILKDELKRSLEDEFYKLIKNYNENIKILISSEKEKTSALNDENISDEDPDNLILLEIKNRNDKIFEFITKDICTQCLNFFKLIIQNEYFPLNPDNYHSFSFFNQSFNNQIKKKICNNVSEIDMSIVNLIKNLVSYIKYNNELNIDQVKRLINIIKDRKRHYKKQLNNLRRKNNQDPYIEHESSENENN